MTTRLNQPQPVAIDSIHVDERRPLDPKKVQYIAASVEENGLLQPVGLNKKRRLLFGRHRVESHKLLKKKEILAVFLDVDDLHAELARIDENLMRSDPEPLDLGEDLLRRKEIYEELYPEAKHGGDRKSSGKNCHLIESFAEDAAAKLGRKARTVREYMKTVERIPHNLREELRQTDVGKKLTELQKVSSLPEVDQAVVVERIVAGAKSVIAAIEAVDEADRSEEMLKLLPPKEAEECDEDQAHAAEDPVEEEVVATESPAVTPSDNGTSDDASQMVGGPVEDDAAAADPVQEAPVGHADGHQDAPGADRVAVYRGMLLELREMTDFLYEHVDEVCGRAMEPMQAASLLDNVIETLCFARDVERSMADMAEESPVPAEA